MKRIIAVALMLAGSTAFAAAQAPAADPHHPQGAPSAQHSAPSAQQPAPQPQGGGSHGMMGGMPMMNMMGNMMDMPMMRMMHDMSMMNMMGMMRQMGMMGPGSSGMSMIDRVEGRIAFLRAELRITDAQASAWNTFADALRANARKLAEVRAAATAHGGGLVQRLDAQEQWLTARLDGTRTLKAAVAALSGVLSDEQKKSADELLAPHMGMTMMMPGAMARMQGGPAQQGPMMPGQRMPGQMMPGQMMPGQMMPGQMPSR